MSDSLFDIGGASALYLALYLGTLSLHAVLMSYVLAGSGYVAAAAVLGARDRDPASRALRDPAARVLDDPVARILRDWLPFGLGTAITAGVAPLLFLQILYKESFYTANLLLFHRWMAMVPVLIAGFYLLYVVKSKAAKDGPRLRRTIVAVGAPVGAFLCFGFAAWSWTGNHMVALERTRWLELYTSTVPVPSLAMLMRLATWLAGSAPIMAMIVGWQLRRLNDSSDAHRRARRRLAVIALGGLALSAGFGSYHAFLLDEGARAALRSAAVVFLAPLGLGMALQAGAWLALARAGAWSRAVLGMASVGVGLAVIGTAVAREVVRMAAVDFPREAVAHARAAESGGIVAFFVFLVINTGLIVWCVRATRRALREKG
jgi:hypothetical protein